MSFRFNFFEPEEEEQEAVVCCQNSTKLSRSGCCGEVALAEAKVPMSDFQQIDLSDGFSLKILEGPDASAAGLAVAADKDVVADVYEGGFKLWECAIYLLRFCDGRKISFEGKTVAELGCGAGTTGLYGLLKGAKLVVFQDFNRQVIDTWTIPNVLANDRAAGRQRTKFFFGDWGDLAALDSFTADKFDVVLMSETIYVESSYAKLKALIAKCLVRPHGVAYLASKSYYFGTGGSVTEFTEFIQSEHPGDPHRFVVRNELEINTNICCVICSIKWQ